MPNEAIEYIKLELEDRKSNKKERNVRKGFGLSVNRTMSIPQKEIVETVEDEDIDDMFDADFFRF